MSPKTKCVNRFTVRLDEETDRLLMAYARKLNIDPSKAVREAIRLAACDVSQQRIADNLEEIVLRLSDMPGMAKNMRSLSSQMGDMAAANNANTDRIAGILKILLERTK